MRYIVMIIAFLAAFSFRFAQAQTSISAEPFINGLASPLDIAHAGDERLFIVEQGGEIHISDQAGNLNTDPFIDLSGSVSQSGGERGLIGLTFHPDYEENGYFYVKYTHSFHHASVISRFSVDEGDPDKGDPDSETILMTVSQPYPNHNGGDIRFGPDGYLYIAIGDGGGSGDPDDNAQDTENRLGTIMRIDVNEGDPYGIPDNNPFVNDPDIHDEIWAYGLRNPWRNSFDRFTGDFWIADVGQRDREIVNFETAGDGGHNYGWRCYEGTMEFNLDGCGDSSEYTFPIYEYEHYGTGCTGSITGGYVYRGAIHGNLHGIYLAGDYCHGDFYTVNKAEDFSAEQPGSFHSGEITSFGEDVYGELYITAHSSGEVLKITEDTGCEPAAIVKGPSERAPDNDNEALLEAVYHPELEYQWYQNGNPIQGADSFQYTATEEGDYSVEVTNPGNQCSAESDITTVTSEPVNFIQGQGSGHEDVELTVRPNPASSNILVEGWQKGRKVSLKVYDPAGKLWYEAEEHDNPSIGINAGNWPEGIYMIHVITEEQSLTESFIISR